MVYYTGGSPNFNERTGQILVNRGPIAPKPQPLPNYDGTHNKKTLLQQGPSQQPQPTYSTMPVGQPKPYQPPNTMPTGQPQQYQPQQPQQQAQPRTTYQQPQQQNPYQNATNRASSILAPQQASSLRAALDNVKQQSMGSGFYGQLPQVQYSADVAGQIEAQNQGAIAQLAQSLYSDDRQFGLQESNITGNYNGAPTMQAQQMALEKAYQDAQLTGLYNGASTLQAQQMAKDNAFNEANLTGLYGNQETLQSKQARENLAQQWAQLSGYMPSGGQTLGRELGIGGLESQWFNNWLAGNQSFYNPGTTPNALATPTANAQQTISQLPPTLQPMAQEVISYATNNTGTTKGQATGAASASNDERLRTDASFRASEIARASAINTPAAKEYLSKIDAYSKRAGGK